MSMPKVSVVTATYERSNVLRYTIESVLAQTLDDWEMIVVGDACTDDTEEVVARFGNERIRFVNLPVNSGEQATPNNEGVRLARGEYIAFLNHDDLWTPDHLATCVREIGDGDFVSTLTLSLPSDGQVRLLGVCPNGEYGLDSEAIVASSWLVRRTLALSIPWRPARELYNAPSQDWLFRAWKEGHRLRSLSRATVIAIPSGSRAGSYAGKEFAIHAQYAHLLRHDPELIERLLTAVAVLATTAVRELSFGRAFKNAVRRTVFSLGIHPHALLLALRYRRKGGFLDSLRRTRGLPPLPREDVR